MLGRTLPMNQVHDYGRSKLYAFNAVLAQAAQIRARSGAKLRGINTARRVDQSAGGPAPRVWGLMVRDCENCYLEWDPEQASALNDVIGHAVT